MTDSKRPLIVEGFEAEAFEGETVLVHPESQAVIYCNATTFLIWQMCDGTRSVKELVELLQETYPDVPELQTQVNDMIATLFEHGALCWA